jgi:uncharacterized membrane protein YebE (DUF533 family)
MLLTAAVAIFQTQPQESGGAGGGELALLVLVVAIAAWLGARALVRRLQASKTEAVVHGDFAGYALEALVNAAKLDGRVAATERIAILQAMGDLAGAGFESSKVDAAFAAARLNKDELVAYLAERASAFTHAQKTSLLKALLAVFVADGRFDAAEHHALMDYTAAIGFDRQSAGEMLRGLARDFERGNIT